MNKKMRQVLLTFLLVFTVILAGSVLADNTVTEGKITVNKVASKDIGIEGNETYGRKSNVTLSVTGNEFTTSSTLDVVLVLDRSSSMHKNGTSKLSDAKSAAIELVDTLLANNTEDRTVVKMGVVTFGKTVIDKWSNNSLSANKSDVVAKINAITSDDDDIPGNTNGQGTNIQSGLAKANELLKDSTAKNKVVILLTDGEPTLFNYNGYVYGDGSSDSEVCVERSNGWCIKKVKPSDAAKTEATTLKNANVEIYTVGFGLKDNARDDWQTKQSKANARAFLQDIATKDESPYYLLAENKDDLTNSFGDIVKSMTTIATNVVVEDIVPVGFEVDVEALKNTYGDNVVVTYNDDGTTTITWKIGTLKVTNDPTLTYEVTARDGYYGGMYTNTEAILTGDAEAGNPSYPNGKIEEVFPLPIIAIPSITNNDNYTAKLGENLIVTPDKGISINDSNVKLEEGKYTKVEDEIIIKSTTCGSVNDIKVNDDGSFEYLPNSSCYAENDEVTFEYEVKSTVTIDGVEYTVISNTSTITIDLTKDEAEVKDPVVTKINNNGDVTTSITGPFDYTIKYSTTMENHVGATTITIVDTLPYELDLTKEYDLNGGTYNEEDKTITWVETIENIDSYKNQNNNIKIEKTIKVFYKNVPTDVDTIKNTATVTTDIDNTPVTGEEETKVVRGTVTAEYTDTLGNALIPSITTKGLVDTTYETSADKVITKDGVEYKLVATKVNGKDVEKTTNYTGIYTIEDTTVTYIYYKVTGEIDEEQTVFTKEGPEVITTSDGIFNYTITYENKIDNYIGDAVVTIVDYLPYELDLTKEYDLKGGKYDASAKTITWVENINNIDTFTNGTYTVNVVKNIKVVFKGLDANERTLINEVKAKLETSKSNSEDKTNEETELAIKGNVIAHYIDTNNNTIADDYKESDLVGNEYTTSAKTINGYKLVEVQGNPTGTYIDGTIEVTYIYYKLEGNILDDTITKTGTNEVTETDATFEYSITYNAVINNYIGNAVVTIVDTLPYELDETKDNDLDGGIYDASAKTITWVEKLENIDTNKNGQYLVKIFKDIKVVYKDMEPTTRVVTNSVVGTIKTEVTEKTTEPAQKNTTVKVSGKVIANYIDTNNNTLVPSIENTGLVGDAYTTSAKTIAGYKLVEVQGSSVGTYIDGTIEVTYVYYKVEGNIGDNAIIKTGTEEVTETDAGFEYTITYNTIIKNYIGDATITMVDTLPYELDLASDYDLNGGIYDKDAKTITWVETINDIDTNKNGEYKVEVVKNIKVSYLGIDPTTRIVTNSVVGTIKTDVKEETTEPSTHETLVKVSGEVIANYVDTLGNTLIPSITTSGLVGDSYTTSEKDIANYELVEVIGNPTGKYTEDTTCVTYVYYKETGEIIGDTLTKEGTDEVFSTDSPFEYKITYNAVIKNYIGNATVTIVDTLPYELDLTNNYDLDGGKYDATTRTITWVETIDNIDTNKNGEYKVNIVKNIKVTYLGLDPTIRNVTNKVVGNIKTDVTEENTEPATKDTAVKVSGNVITNYVDTLGNTLIPSITTSGLVGNEYVTEEKTIEGYELVEINGNITGKYIVEDTIVTYIYYKETGNITEDKVEKIGSEEITLSNDKVNYTINYKAKIDNYIGNAVVTIVDYLPYELDLVASNLSGGTYNEEDKTITWNITITNIDTFNNGTYNIDITKNLVLAYKDIDLTSEVITNKVSATVKTDLSEESTKDSFDTEVNVNGTVEVNYVDESGNVISEMVTLTGKVGTIYETSEKTIDGYILVNVIGDVTGEYIDGKYVVTYIYTEAGKGGDVEVLPPQTGINNNSFINLLISLIAGIVIAIKNLF